jgi:Na+/phosphate symporter
VTALRPSGVLERLQSGPLTARRAGRAVAVVTIIVTVLCGVAMWLVDRDEFFKETVEIHPFLSVVAVIVFTSLFGIVGALIAVPVTKAIEILVAAVRAGREAAVLEPPLPSPEIGE